MKEKANKDRNIKGGIYIRGEQVFVLSCKISSEPLLKEASISIRKDSGDGQKILLYILTALTNDVSFSFLKPSRRIKELFAALQ